MSSIEIVNEVEDVNTVRESKEPHETLSSNEDITVSNANEMDSQKKPELTNNSLCSSNREQ